MSLKKENKRNKNMRNNIERACTQTIVQDREGIAFRAHQSIEIH